MKKLLLGALLSAFTASSAFCQSTLHIYTARHYDADAKLYDLFTEQTGIKVKATQAKDAELIKKLQTEGDKTPADLFITADVSNLNQAKVLGLLASSKSETLNSIIPANLRDVDGTWYGFTKRARIVAYDKTRTKNPKIKTYEDLAKPEFKGKILMRSATAAYSKTLLASIIVADGRDEAKKWAKGVLSNLAQNPKGGDRDQAKAMVAGVGEYAVMNTYYVGLMLSSKNQKDVAVGEKLGIIFPNQNGRGTHINISGAAVLKASQNKENALKFMDFLLSAPAQRILADINYEYPVNKDVEPNPLIASFGKFKEDATPLSKIADNVKEAVLIYDEVGFR